MQIRSVAQHAHSGGRVAIDAIRGGIATRAAAQLRGEDGQTALMLMALMGLLMALGVMVVDVGMAYGSRREAQTAADLAALAGAGLLPDDPTGAQTLVLDYLKSNGLDPADPDVTAQVSFPTANQIEVLISAPSQTFFSGVFALNGLDRVSDRAVAEGQPDVPGGRGPGGGAAPPIPIPVLPAASPAIDGRVTTGDGYTKLGDLYGGSTDYGDIFVTRDGFFISFALVLNGPYTSGPVGNENVYYRRAKDNGGVDRHADYQTGWKKHDFKALKKSDRAHSRSAATALSSTTSSRTACDPTAPDGPPTRPATARS